MVRQGEDPERADQALIGGEEATREGSESAELLNHHRKPKQNKQRAVNRSTEEEH